MWSGKKCSSLTPVFENREKGKINYYVCYVFGGLGFKAADWREDGSAFSDSGDSRFSSNAMPSCSRWLSFSLSSGRGLSFAKHSR